VVKWVEKELERLVEREVVRESETVRWSKPMK
jgi:hypothetical protein